MVMSNILRKTQKAARSRKKEMISELPHNIHFPRCIFLYLCITFNSGVIANSSCASAIIGSNFLLTEWRSKCEKRELNREKCHWGSRGGETFIQKCSAEMDFFEEEWQDEGKEGRMRERKLRCYCGALTEGHSSRNLRIWRDRKQLSRTNWLVS